jgi:hypothetical protein
MVGSAERVLPIEVVVDAGMLLPVVEHLVQRATWAEHERHVPDQQVDVEIGTLLDQRGQEPAQLGRRVGRIEPDPGIEVPAEDHDARARLPKRLRQRPVIGRAIDQNGGAIGLRAAPAGHALFEDPGRPPALAASIAHGPAPAP